MNILAFDTTTNACSAAVLSEGKILAEKSIKIRIGHAEKLIPMIIEVIENANLTFKEISGIGVTRGPGSFAGVRIGLATARAVALASNKPLLGVVSLKVIAAGLKKDQVENKIIVPVMDARKGQCYVAIYKSNLNTILEPFAMDFGKTAKIIASTRKDTNIIVAGSGSNQLSIELEKYGVIAEVPLGDHLPRASVLARVTCEIVQREGWPKTVVSPLYLRDSGASPPSGIFLKNA